jgi:tetratricopeptide (TPR) repeat protein
MNREPESGLSKRIPRMVGREEELNRLRNLLHARGERHVVYYWAHGGLGKTRLLEELLRMVKQSGPGFYTSGIIDLYHTDTHSTSDVERAIVDGLDPDKKYFNDYRRERKQYEILRERGTDPGVLEKRREELANLFVTGCREMALDARKLVICFDTVELLQYESWVVEEMAGLETMDTRIKPWLLEKLSQLANTLIVFAGRPKKPAPGDPADPQARLVTDFEAAFGDDLTVVPLPPLNLEETEDFIEALTEEGEIVPEKHLPIVHRLVSGRPIFLHLIVDLIQALSPEPRNVLDMFDQYSDLIDTPEDDDRLEKAQQKIEVEILNSLYNETGELGGYLSRIALMPKGINSSILEEGIGLPPSESARVMSQLAPLSFVKQFKELPGAERLHVGRTFLHDEMYRLLTSDVIRNLRINERQVAHSLVANYYDVQIAQLESQIEECSVARERVPLRERLQKLHVEQLYYLLVFDPQRGYAEYKRLSDRANRRRWVGYGMRLLDEFLRLYNTAGRRTQFEEAGISHHQIIRESAQMWVERFFWWGQYNRTIEFARRILDAPEDFSIQPTNFAIIGNICALWARARATLYGYESDVVAEAQNVLGQLPSLAESSEDQILARARLSTSIGYQCRRGGLLARAATQYVEASAAFRKLGKHPDELAMLLNNLAHVYALQGRIPLARPLAHEALRVNEQMGNEYSTGLTLVILASIELLRRDYSHAIKYGEEALALFRDLEDAHGMMFAYLRIGRAERKMAKESIETERKLEETRKQLEAAQQSLDSALTIAGDAGLESDIPRLLAEQGRIHREMGRLVCQLEGEKKGQAFFQQSQRLLREALEKGKDGPVVDQANALQDLADVLFLIGDQKGAEQCLVQVQELIGADHHIVPGQPMPKEGLPTEHFSPLGKVEMTRGQIAFSQNQFEDGLRHFVMAYAYFMRFSLDAAEQDSLVEYLYKRLHDLPVDQQQTLMETIRNWSREYNMDAYVGEFVQTISNLVGV